MAPGRGGAGNYEAAASLQAMQSSRPHGADLEAHNPATIAPIGITEAPEHISGDLKISGQDYMRTGRGGAGNYVTPIDVIAASTTVPACDTQSSSHDAIAGPSSTFTPPALTMKSPVTPLYSGRGGAGNYRGYTLPSTQEDDKAKTKEHEEALKKSIEDDVEAGLPRPAAAWLGGREEASAP